VFRTNSQGKCKCGYDGECRSVNQGSKPKSQILKQCFHRRPRPKMANTFHRDCLQICSHQWRLPNSIILHGCKWLKSMVCNRFNTNLYKDHCRPVVATIHEGRMRGNSARIVRPSFTTISAETRWKTVYARFRFAGGLTSMVHNFPIYILHESIYIFGCGLRRNPFDRRVRTYPEAIMGRLNGALCM